MPWRSIRARSAARLRRTVGPLASQNADAGQTRQRDIIGNNRTSSGNNRTSSGHIRAYPGIVRASSGHRRIRNDHRVPYRLSPVTPSRIARRCGIARRRIACGQACRVRYHRSPDTASRMVVTCGIAGRRTRRGGWSSRAVSPVAGSRAVSPVAGSRLIISRPVSATSCLCRRHRRAHRTPVVCHAPAQHGL